MKISVVGGGPAGMYFSILVKKALPHTEINIYEQNNITDSFGFGVVFSDETLSEFLTKDAESYELIRSKFAYWDNLDVYRDGDIVRITGNGFCGCSRKTLLELLANRCIEVGVNIHSRHRIDDLSTLADSDMIIAADGINSLVRSTFQQEFETTVVPKNNRFVWMGSTKPLDAFTYFFKNTAYGPFVAHSYQYEEGKSTWVIETTEDSFQKAGFVVDDEEGTRKKLEEIFAKELDGHPLLTNRSHWRNFPLITNKKWHKDNVILLGDAVASAHFSIGSGTKLAMEEAIALSNSVIANEGNVSKIFSSYEEEFRPRVESIQNAANISMAWFEAMDRHIKQPDFLAFAFDVMSRSRKVTYENQAIRDKGFTQKVLAAFNERNRTELGKSPAFSPFVLRGMHVNNRIVMSAMGQYAAENGLINDWHLMHYGARATGGVGLIISEMTAIDAVGRISPFCAGIYTDFQANSWKRVVDFVHEKSEAKIGLQIGHSGRKGSLNRTWQGGFVPMEDEGWPLVSVSEEPYAVGYQSPKSLSKEEIEEIIGKFVEAAKRADMVGFDMVELSACHGMLLGSFLSPLTNKRNDEFGGSLENRLRFPLAVFKAIRSVVDSEKPVSVKLSVEDWKDGGNTIEDGIKIARAFKDAGADLISVTSGGTVPDQVTKEGPMWQVPLADAIKHDVGIPVMAIGQFTTIDQINTTLLADRADLIGLGKALLVNPGFVLQSAAYERESLNGMVPGPYQVGVAQLYKSQSWMRNEFEKMKIALKPQSHR
ncbi:FAD-dependent monooxygenase [Sphingobacterium daejeonense]|uniref:oxidoreductase n=1 Tax=Sphingobacterium daejeonense TaxID=371142 RepID=UPI0021A537DD|nr:FAD-dependent monooxygenase [Sphingobacterium daejeonense]MCT1531926.1 FAD-dependent monooxygenase [Sphingobacterium daejeonense]